MRQKAFVFSFLIWQAPDAGNALERDGGHLVGLAGGQQEVAGVTALDLDDVRFGSEAADVFGEDDFGSRHGTDR